VKGMAAKVPEDTTVIDATNLIVGRLSSIVAKRLLEGERIAIVNAEKAVFSGKKSRKVKEFKAFLEIVGRANPIYGPRHPRRPNTILQRVIRGMLPMKKPKGRKAFTRLRVFIGSPPELVGKNMESMKDASADQLRCGLVTLEKISREIGWSG